LWNPPRSALEAHLPDYLCYVPRKRNYFARSSFSSLGIFRDPPTDWEEFLWHGQPFGFHVRCFPKSQLRNENVSYVADVVGPQIESVLNQLRPLPSHRPIL
jgi:hypothetical protein